MKLKKEFALSQSYNVKWDTLMNEASKCILVCCRCHREIHEGMHDLSKLKYNVDFEKIKDCFKRIRKENVCLGCGTKTYNKYYCSIKCNAESQERIKWDDEQLINMYVKKKICVNKLCSIFNLSYNAIKKRLKKLKVFKQIKSGSIV